MEFFLHDKGYCRKLWVNKGISLLVIWWVIRRFHNNSLTSSSFFTFYANILFLLCWMFACISPFFNQKKKRNIKRRKKMKQFCVQVETPPFTCHRKRRKLFKGCEYVYIENVEYKNYTKIIPLGWILLHVRCFFISLKSTWTTTHCFAFSSWKWKLNYFYYAIALFVNIIERNLSLFAAWE